MPDGTGKEDPDTLEKGSRMLFYLLMLTVTVLVLTVTVLMLTMTLVFGDVACDCVDVACLA